MALADEAASPRVHRIVPGPTDDSRSTSGSEGTGRTHTYRRYDNAPTKSHVHRGTCAPAWAALVLGPTAIRARIGSSSGPLPDGQV